MWVKPADHLVLYSKNILDSNLPFTAIGEHCKNHNHNIKIDVQVIAREEHFWKGKIREAIEIRTHQSSLNRDAGHNLPAIYDDLLSHNLSQTEGHVTRRASSQHWMKRGQDDLASYVSASIKTLKRYLLSNIAIFCQKFDGLTYESQIAMSV